MLMMSIILVVVVGGDDVDDSSSCCRVERVQTVVVLPWERSSNSSGRRTGSMGRSDRSY